MDQVNSTMDDRLLGFLLGALDERPEIDLGKVACAE